MAWVRVVGVVGLCCTPARLSIEHLGRGHREGIAKGIAIVGLGLVFGFRFNGVSACRVMADGVRCVEDGRHG